MLALGWLCFGLIAPVHGQFEGGGVPAEFSEMFGGFFRSTPAEQAELDKIQVDWRTERDYGKRSVDAYLTQLRRARVKVERSGKSHQYLSELVGGLQPLMANAKRYTKIVVYLAKSGEFDARSFPGGYLVFHDGIFEVAESEAALVGIIAHELAHLDHGHQLRPIKRMQQMQRGFGNVGQFSSFEMMKRMSSMGKDFHPFHPEDEAVADRDGVRWTFRLGYDPSEFQRMFLRLNERNAGKPAAVAAASMPSFLRTHPLNSERAAAVSEQLRLLSAESPAKELVIGRENLKRRVPVERAAERRR